MIRSNDLLNTIEENPIQGMNISIGKMRARVKRSRFFADGSFHNRLGDQQWTLEMNR
jgi:hypothetical protein